MHPTNYTCNNITKKVGKVFQPFFFLQITEFYRSENYVDFYSDVYKFYFIFGWKNFTKTFFFVFTFIVVYEKIIGKIPKILSLIYYGTILDQIKRELL